MTYPRSVAAGDLLDPDGTVVGAADLSLAFGITFYDEWNGPGHGAMSMALSDSNAAYLTPGRFVNIEVEGTVRFTFKIEGNPQYAQIQRGEEYEQIVNVKGRGWACVLDEAIVYPEVELNSRIDSSWRLFSFASPSFPNAGGWSPAVELYEFLDGVAEGKRLQAIDGNLYPSPVNFPWPISANNGTPPGTSGGSYSPTYWIWTEEGDPSEEFEIGWAFFRNEFTLTADTIVTFAATGDNFFTLFVEGVPIIGEDADHWIWQGWKEVPIALSAGTYTIAAVVENVGFPGQTGPISTNPGGFIATVHEVDGNQVPTTVHLVTDDSWDCVFVSNTGQWPGWTPGQIAALLVSEPVARGAMAAYSSDTYTDSVDSNGDAWRPLDPTVDSLYASSFAVEIGSSVLEAYGLLHEQGWINWHVQPGTFVVDIYRGREPTPSSSATLAAGVNLMSLERAETEAYANALLVQWDQGLVEVVDAAAVTAAGTRIEAIYSADATSSADAEQQGRTELIKRAQAGFPAITAGVEPVSTADCPYEGFDLGDYVTIPNTSGGTELVKVLAINCAQDAEGNAEWTLELNRKLRVPERDNQKLLRSIGGRLQAVRGRVD
jgi:hypothetical protein